MIVLTDKKFESPDTIDVADFSATVFNASEENLSSFEIQISIKDCDLASTCPVIYRKIEYIYLPVPSGEKRAFSRRVYLTDIPPLTKPTVTFAVTSTISE